MGEYVIKLPDIGEGVAEAELVEWLVSEGDMVREDAPLAAVMTDKANVEIPSPVDGKIILLGPKVGDVVAVGSVIIRLDVAGDGNTAEIDIAASVDISGETSKLKPANSVLENKQPTQTSAKGVEIPDYPPSRQITAFRRAGERPLASPAVRRRALQSSIDIRLVPGSGSIGQIHHSDLDAFIEDGVQPHTRRAKTINLTVSSTPVIGLRRKIAQKMTRSSTEIPHITIVEEIDVTDVEKLRHSLNGEREEKQTKITLLPFVMQALVRAIKDHPEMSAHYIKDDNLLHRFGAVHIGIATQTERGLVVPVVKHAESLNLWESAAELIRISNAARAGTATREALSGSTITITSLGALGGISTTPIINHPELAIIGINKIRTAPVWDRGAFIPRKMMNLSSSFDHRFIDGWDAALFVQKIKALLEAPGQLFIGADT